MFPICSSTLVAARCCGRDAVEGPGQMAWSGRVACRQTAIAACMQQGGGARVCSSLQQHYFSWGAWGRAADESVCWCSSPVLTWDPSVGRHPGSVLYAYHASSLSMNCHLTLLCMPGSHEQHRGCGVLVNPCMGVGSTSLSVLQCASATRTSPANHRLVQVVVVVISGPAASWLSM
jgi:hypothetical protein